VPEGGDLIVTFADQTRALEGADEQLAYRFARVDDGTDLTVGH
jgi:hypothetical protein